MQQRYKVFIYDSPVFLINSTESHEANSIVEKWGSNQTILIKGIKEGKYRNEPLVITCVKVEKAWIEFQSYFKLITAAGGAVFKNEELLVIKRLGRIDLPKGKLEKGENISECAIREVEEECGIDQINIIKPLLDTYHCYFFKEKWVLKRTVWYLMNSTTNLETKPQIEEDIEWVKWIPKKNITKVMKDTYPSIQDVLKSLN